MGEVAGSEGYRTRGALAMRRQRTREVPASDLWDQVYTLSLLTHVPASFFPVVLYTRPPVVLLGTVIIDPSQVVIILVMMY